MWGTVRSRINNMIEGVSVGYVKELVLNGVGYKAVQKGKVLELLLGYSHPINFQIPEDLKVEVPKPTEIKISGIDKQRVGQIAANIRSYRKPEPYKGKGIKYKDEIIRRKEGKKKVMMNMSKKIRRTNRIRYKLKLKNNLRLSLFRSNNHIYAQLIDDEKKITIISASSREKNP